MAENYFKQEVCKLSQLQFAIPQTLRITEKTAAKVHKNRVGKYRCFEIILMFQKISEYIQTLETASL